jgi:O-antigen biosynthesis protein
MGANRSDLTGQYTITHSDLSTRFGRSMPDEQLNAFLDSFTPPSWAQGAIEPYDALFLYELIGCAHPSRVLEIGTASGVSSAVILRALADAGGEGPGPRLLTFDISPHCYFDPSRPVGSAVQEMVPSLMGDMKVFAGKTAFDAAQMLAHEPVPFAFIDGDHRHPFPTLDLLSVLPAVKPGGWIVLHDIDLPKFARLHEERTGTKVDWYQHGARHLFELWPFEKIEGKGGAYNIGALRLPDNRIVTVEDLMPVLDRTWEADTAYVRELAGKNPIYAAALKSRGVKAAPLSGTAPRFPGLPVPDVAGSPSKPLKICIVCSEFVGPHRNGGMGTAVTSLGLSLANHGHEVTFLYTRGSDCLNGTIEDWVRHYAARQITFVPLMAADEVDLRAASGVAAQSYRVYRWLKSRTFDVVHFPELEGPGYYSMLAKRQGLAFRNTLLCIETHSPTAWLYEAQQLFYDGVSCLETDFMERSALGLADAVIGPSAYLLGWMQEHGWRLPERTYVQQYVLPEYVRLNAPAGKRDTRRVNEIVFFGRLEERKGLRIFCDALDILAREKGRRFTVTFMGKSAQIGSSTGADFIKERGAAWSFRFQHLADLNEQEATAYLRQAGRLAVMPSITDNSPNTVYECIAAQIPFIAAASGGIPELIAEEDRSGVTFAVNATALAARLREVLDAGIVPARPAVPFDENEQQWLAWHDALCGEAQGAAASAGQAAKAAVSLCIACRDHPEFLPALLDSVRTEGAGVLEVLVVDDGTAAPREVREAIEHPGSRPLPKTQLLHTDRRGRGAAWNAAACAARGEFLLFLSDQDTLKPGCVDTLVRAARNSSAEALICCSDTLQSEGGRDALVSRTIPLGAPPAAVMLNNYAGTSGAFVRKEAFDRLGGFLEDCAVNDVAWEFLNRIVRAGVNLQVVPEVLLRSPQPDPSLFSPEAYYRDATHAAMPWTVGDYGTFAVIMSLVQGLRLGVVTRDHALARYRAALQEHDAPHAKLLGAANIMLDRGEAAASLSLLRAAQESMERAGLRREAAKLAADIRKLEASRGRRETARRTAPPQASKKEQEAPLVSVVIPCYNQAQYLPDAIASVLAQTVTDWELIVVNDGSPDNTSDIVREIIAWNAGKRIRLIEKPNGGLGSARNAGMKAAAGTFIVPLDADDRLAPGFLEKTLPVMDRQPDVGFVYSHIQHFGDRSDLWELPEFDARTIACVDNTACVTALIRKEAYEQVGGYSESMRPQGYEDWDFWVGCIEKGWSGYRIPEPLFLYRIRKESMLKESNSQRPYLFARIVLNHASLYDEQTVEVAQQRIREQETTGVSVAPGEKGLRITYLISSILGVTGGNQTLLAQANALIDRGHRVTIVTCTDAPAWFPLKADVVRVPDGKPMSAYVPPSDEVISTYFTNTAELLRVNAPVKVYYAQGDQFIFEDWSKPLKPEYEAVRRQLMKMSRDSYRLSDIRFVANSENLARMVERKYKRKADAILPVCVDQTIFRPLERPAEPGRFRILVVGPDVRGTPLEPLTFKGIGDIRSAVELLSRKRDDFTVVRVSNSVREIFDGIPCEFHIAPGDELKTRLFGTADMLVYASHYDSCPRPPLEAMASGAAVVCTATPGAMEYCRDGENALLVPVRNPCALRDAMLRLMDDDELRARLVNGGLATAAQFPREREWNELEALLYTFLKGHPSMIQQLKDLAMNGKFEEALAEAEKLPGANEGIEIFKGHCYIQLENLEAAKSCFESALTLNSSSARACEGIGEVLYLAGLFDQSKVMFEWAVKNNPASQVASDGLAMVNGELHLPPAHNSLGA